LLHAALVACQTPAPPAAQVPPTAAPAPPGAEPEPSAPVAAAPLDPQALYAQCRERVEGPEADGECSADADCVRGGCSQEICATPAALADLMSTCEVLPCFQVLQGCGCHEGRCTWTVGAPPADPSAPPVVLPPRDQLPGAAAPSPAG
jgi:eight-cysteine-cluster-containing protein